jgi:hypothetical protein
VCSLQMVCCVFISSPSCRLSSDSSFHFRLVPLQVRYSPMALVACLLDATVHGSLFENNAQGKGAIYTRVFVPFIRICFDLNISA